MVFPKMTWRTDGSIGLIGMEWVTYIFNSDPKRSIEVNLPTPSIGGTMNIITDLAMEKGGKFKQEVGESGFLKTTLNYNTEFSLMTKKN